MSDRLDAALAELAAALRDEIVAAAAVSDAAPALLSIDEAARALGIGRTAVYAAFDRDELRSVKVGRRRLVPADELARVARGSE